MSVIVGTLSQYDASVQPQLSSYQPGRGRCARLRVRLPDDPLHVRDARVHGKDDREVARGGGSGLPGGQPRGDGPGGVAARPVSMCSHSGSRTAVAPIQRPGLAAASSPPRSTRTTAPRGAAAAPRSGPPAAPSSASGCTSAASSPVAGASGSSTARSASQPGWRRPFAGRPRSRAGCQHSSAASSSRAMCSGRDPRPPQARQELAVRGALLGREAYHAYRAAAHRRPPPRGRPRLGEQQVRRRRHRDAAARGGASALRRQRGVPRLPRGPSAQHRSLHLGDHRVAQQRGSRDR